MSIVVAAGSLGVLALLLATLVVLANHFLSVVEDPRLEALETARETTSHAIATTRRLPTSRR